MTLAESLFNRRVSVKDTRIRDTALHYARLGYSVIPVKPKTKKALIAWEKYQTEIMSATDIHKHFENAHGLAVVCGTVSSVLCADFDKIEAYNAFKRDYPDLADTYTESTPNGGMHAFYTLGDDIANTSKTPGVNGDLIANGGYVLVSPSPRYTLEIDTPNVLLSADGLEVLKHYLGITSTDGTPSNIRQNSDESPSADVLGNGHTENEVIAEYHRRADLIGRNNALYSIAVDVSAWWSSEFTKRVLAPIHANKPPTSATHTNTTENVKERLQEAYRTIKSAYKHGRQALGKGLPNELRERLLDAPNGATVARMLDAFYFVGVTPGKPYTEKQLCDLVGTIGIKRDTVRRFLEFGRAVNNVLDGLTDGELTNENTLENTAIQFCAKMSAKHTFMYVLCDGNYLGDKNAQNTKHTKNTDTPPPSATKKGRRASVFYSVPSVSELCQTFGVINTRGDTVTCDMLMSVTAYRAGLHLALVRRVQNTDKIHTRRRLAQRLGVKGRTLLRYEKTHGIQAESVMGERVMTFNEAKTFTTPNNEPLMSHFVEIDGKRYAYSHHHRQTFLKALADGKHVTVKWYRGIKLSAHTHTATTPSAIKERDGVTVPTRQTTTDTLLDFAIGLGATIHSEHESVLVDIGTHQRRDGVKVVICG